jgi:hypothetical protein
MKVDLSQDKSMASERERELERRFREVDEQNK